MNKVILIGNIGNKPELNEQGTVANFSVATNKQYKDKEGKKVKKTEWHRVVAFGKTAEIICEFFDKGSKIAIEGELQTREYEKDGVKKYTTEIIANNFEFVDSKKDELDD